MKTYLISAIAFGLIAACSQTPPATPAEQPLQTASKEEGAKRLTGAEIKSAVSDQDLRGCYADNQRWGERLDANGDLFDLMNDTRPKTGAWYVAGDQLCFHYEAQPEGRLDSCFSVERVSKGLVFFSAGASTPIAATYCPMTTEAPAPSEG